MREPKSTPDTPSRRKRAALGLLTVFLGLAVGLVLAEGALRIFYRGQSAKKNTDHLTNRGRWRDTEHAVQKPAGAIRIAFFGDSMTYGQGVEFEDTFAFQTGEILRRELNRTDIEILNFGVPAYNILDNLENLKTNVLRYEPDIIVYGYCINDFNFPGAEARLAAKLQKEVARFRIFGFLERHSKVAYFVDWILYQLFSKARRLHHDWMVESLDPAINPWYLEMKRSVADIVEILSKKNGLVVILPIFNSQNEDQLSYYAKARALVVERCVDLQVGFVDVFPKMKFKPPKHWWVSVDDHHPNKKGHALIARLIADALLEKQLSSLPRTK